MQTVTPIPMQLRKKLLVGQQQYVAAPPPLKPIRKYVLELPVRVFIESRDRFAPSTEFKTPERVTKIAKMDV
jgi:hypothetical protein